MPNRITLQTTVKEAVECCPEAADIFEQHGVNPQCACKGMYSNITIEEAEEWCSIKDVTGLVEELNMALTKAQAQV